MFYCLPDSIDSNRKFLTMLNFVPLSVMCPFLPVAVWRFFSLWLIFSNLIMLCDSVILTVWYLLSFLDLQTHNTYQIWKLLGLLFPQNFPALSFLGSLTTHLHVRLLCVVLGSLRFWFVYPVLLFHLFASVWMVSIAMSSNLWFFISILI